MYFVLAVTPFNTKQIGGNVDALTSVATQMIRWQWR